MLQKSTVAEYGKIEEVVAGLHYTLDYGWLDIIADPLSWGIHKINNFVGSWGWSIILITMLIKLVFYPLSEKSYRSMANMRKLAPRLAKLKETYGDDKLRPQSLSVGTTTNSPLTTLELLE
jgi:YidC/Oxa1 family membrane protein insertase